jgi:hypothetical protein
MKAGVAFAAFVAMSMLNATALACACGVPGLDSALTSKRDRWGVRLGETVSVGHGRWDAHGRYRALAPSDHDYRYDFEALVAVRPLPRWEVSASTSLTRVSRSESGASVSALGLGDTFARARYELLDESAPHDEGVPWPALALLGSLRLPTAEASEAGSLGLGAYEVAIGVSLERSIDAHFRLGASVVIAERARDDSLGAPRKLGPRVTSQVIGWYWPTANVALSLASNLTWEDEVSYDGHRQVGSGFRQWQVGAGVALQPEGSSVRPGVRVRYAPPLAGVGVGGLGETTVDLYLAYSR